MQLEANPPCPPFAKGGTLKRSLCSIVTTLHLNLSVPIFSVPLVTLSRAAMIWELPPLLE